MVPITVFYRMWDSFEDVNPLSDTSFAGRSRHIDQALS